ncbi:MAG: HTH-type transcriptional regulator PuuR [Paracidovorax wautersii]|uniref:HTH-type transcriptional regulator PuuR n=1 Tax=Paracidovorax wautersii TaxID=1177982 RepID=A0A7V8FNS6_9BURK|nr:MAG: HTH-type transcriptional regulator PuuR [Paracidovorax wautersii]
MRIRYARTCKSATLKAVAATVGCSESMLSKIECGQANPSLNMLHRIAQALDTNVAELTTVVSAVDSPVQKAQERLVVNFDGNGRHPRKIRLERLVPPKRGQLLQGDIHILEPRAKVTGSIAHLGEEMGYVLQGRLRLTLGDDTYELECGDSFYFASETPHSYMNPGYETTRVLWVNTPATF